MVQYNCFLPNYYRRFLKGEGGQTSPCSGFNYWLCPLVMRALVFKSDVLKILLVHGRTSLLKPRNFLVLWVVFFCCNLLPVLLRSMVSVLAF